MSYNRSLTASLLTSSPACLPLGLHPHQPPVLRRQVGVEPVPRAVPRPAEGEHVGDQADAEGAGGGAAQGSAGQCPEDCGGEARAWYRCNTVPVQANNGHAYQQCCVVHCIWFIAACSLLHILSVLCSIFPGTPWNHSCLMFASLSALTSVSSLFLKYRFYYKNSRHYVRTVLYE